MNFYAIDNQGNKVSAISEIKADKIEIRIPYQKIPSGIERLTVTGDLFQSKVHAEGFYLCGIDFGQSSSFVTYFKEREDFEYIARKGLLNVFGIQNSNQTYMGTVSGMEHEYYWKIVKAGDNYTFGIMYDVKSINFYEDIVLELFCLDKEATYLDIAKKYREYMLEERRCVPIKQRKKEQPMLEYIKDSVEIRIRMAWKPAPSPIEDQTLENEPEMHVACTFDNVKNFVTRLKASGVEKAEICLIVWNVKGHDGRWPTTFPVEPALGGEEKLRELISYAKECGYKIIGHTNSTDCYHISEYFDNGEIATRHKNGNINRNASWSGGRMYDLCPEKAWEFAQDMLPQVADLGFEGAHYIDVISYAPIRTCFHEKHPCTGRQTVEYYEKIANLSKKLFGGFSSEGTFDHAAHYLDYGLYTKMNRARHVCMDEGVDFWEMVFHGIIMTNPGTNVVNYPIKTPEDRLLIARYNARPAFYVYSAFMSNGQNWMGNNDLKIDSEESITKTVSVIKKAYDEYQEVSYLQEEYIEECKCLSEDVYVTTYSDGTSIVVNYNDTEYVNNNIAIGAKDYIVIHN